MNIIKEANEQLNRVKEKSFGKNLTQGYKNKTRGKEKR